MLSTCLKLLQWWRYFGVCSAQVSHTYSVSQLRPSQVYLSSNRHRQSAQIDVYTHGLHMWLLWCSHLVLNCFNGGGIVDYALLRYPTHILCPNYSHRMCICQAIVIQESLKLTFIHPDSRIDCLHALNLCQTAALTEAFWILLYTCTPHIFGLPTTVIAWLFVQIQAPQKSSNSRLYTRARHLTDLMLSTCAKLMKWWMCFGWCSTQTPRPSLPSCCRVYLELKQRMQNKHRFCYITDIAPD